MKNTTWTTKAGSFVTKEKCDVTLRLPEFHEGKSIDWTVYVDSSDSELATYDMIIGRDMLKELGIDLRENSLDAPKHPSNSLDAPKIPTEMFP